MAESLSRLSTIKLDSNCFFDSIESCNLLPTSKPKSANNAKEQDRIAAAQNNVPVNKSISNSGSAFSQSENEEMPIMLHDDDCLTVTHATYSIAGTRCKKIELSDDVLYHIFSWCDVSDLGLIVSLVSRKWLQLSRAPHLWYQLYHRLYRKQQSYLPEHERKSTCWYNCVQIRHSRSIDLRSNLNSGQTEGVLPNGCIAITNTTPWADSTLLYFRRQIQLIQTRIPIQSIFKIENGMNLPDEVAYFEFEYISGLATIGIVSREIDSSSPQLYHIGWRPTSYAYHNDDGRLYYNNDDPHFINESYESFDFGPPWESTTTNKMSFVVGCGLHLNTNQLFFTHNGVLITPKLRQLPKVKPLQSSYAAAVSLHAPGDNGLLNFGSKTFQFDLESYIYNKD